MENTTKESLFNSLFKEIWSEGVFSLPLIKFFNIKKSFDKETKFFFQMKLLYWERRYNEVVKSIEEIFKNGVLDDRKKYLLYINIIKASFYTDKEKCKWYFVKLKNEFKRIPEEIRANVATYLKSYSVLNDGKYNFRLWGKYLEKEKENDCFYKISLAIKSEKDKDFYLCFKYYAQAVKAAIKSNHQEGLLTSINNFHYLIYEHFPKYEYNIVEFHKYYLSKCFSLDFKKLFNIDTIYYVLERCNLKESVEFLLIADYYFKRNPEFKKYKELREKTKYKYNFSDKSYEVDNNIRYFIKNNVNFDYNRDRYVIRILEENKDYITTNTIRYIFTLLKKDIKDNYPYAFLNEMIKLEKKEKAIKILKKKKISKYQFMSAYISLLDKLDNFTELTKNIHEIYHECLNDKNKLIERINNEDNELSFLICLLDKTDGYYNASMENADLFLKKIKKDKTNTFITTYFELSYNQKEKIDEFIRLYSTYNNKFKQFKLTYDKKLKLFCDNYGLNKHSAALSFYCLDSNYRRVLNLVFDRFNDNI